MKRRYTTKVDKNVRYSIDKFAQEVDIYITDPNGWEGKGYEFVRGSGDIVIHLSSSAFIEKQCHLKGLSCAQMNGKHIWVNEERWKQGSPASKLSLEDYRQYVISHEIGHILGHNHTKCPGKDIPAPIMMQQTKGIGECKPNTSV